MTALETWLRVAVALPLGLAVGSFLTVVVHRVPAGGSVVRPRSRCPSCGEPIRARDNVPVLSWLLLRGRCRSCGARIPVAYPLLELATGGLFVGAALRHPDPWRAALLAPFLAVLLALSVIDARTKRLPNRIVYPSLVVGAGYLLLAWVAGGPVDLVRAGLGLLAYGGGLLIVALISPRGMGMGDVKLAALIGLVLGALGLRYVAVAAGLGILFGGVGAVAALLAGASREQAVPFGPFLAAGAAVAVFVAPELADLYLRLLTP
ncbi:Type 4 prepilin-like proteins leader peptide-processing enzyme [bacterium HR12]|nr:Type 4 prepilin-like proteins leader peptide-processing enzyme [bacterium HR12]